MGNELSSEFEYRARRGTPRWVMHMRKPLTLVSRFWFGWHWRIRALQWMGVNIHGAYIGRDCLFDEEFPELITVEPQVTMSMRVSVIAHDSFRHVVGPVRICSKAFIGIGVIILPGVTIGEGAVIAAGAVVNKSVEPWTMVGGVPAKFIRKVDPSEFVPGE